MDRLRRQGRRAACGKLAGLPTRAGYGGRVILRVTATAALLAASIVALTGCLGPAPEPTPTPTAVFSSEEEAFAAAEETYRAYIDAVNARYADADSDPAPQSLLIGTALEDDLASIRSFNELGIRVVGETSIRELQDIAADLESGDVQIDVCLDSTQTRVLNASGVDVTMAERDPFTALRIDLTMLNDALVIERSVTIESSTC